MFCTPELIFGGTDGVRSRFQVFRSRTHFREVTMASGLRLVFGGTEGVGSHFHVLRSRTRFPWYRVGRVPFFCFALTDSFFAGNEGVGSRFNVLRVRTRFRWYRRRRVPFSCFALLESFSAVPKSSGPIFRFCAPRLVFGDTKGVGSRFHVSRSRTRFPRYRGHQVQSSSFALPDTFSTVMRASALDFMF
jgi:hypothetical protein